MNKCVKINTKKYTTRDSPPYSAMDCKGQKLIGNDGQQYIYQKSTIMEFING